MEIRTRQRAKKTQPTLKPPVRMLSKRARLILLSIVLVSAYTSLTFLAGAQTYRSYYHHEGIGKVYFQVKYFLQHPARIVRNYVRGRFSKPEQINLDIKFKDLQRLSNWRNLALENKTLYGIDHDYVNAQIRYKDDAIPVKIRLKGGGAHDHLGGDKWSLRVKTRGDGVLFGMKTFSLMDPERRGFLLEWLIRRIMDEEGVISKRYKFVKVAINGESKGVYAIDEHYGKTMIEANQRREGPVIRLLQDSLWFEAAAWYLKDSQRDDYYFSASVDSIGSKFSMADPAALDRHQKAFDLFSAFREGDLSTSDVFDVDQLARWMAVGDVMGAWHGFGVYNMRFYYNPITSKLEPVPDDTFNETSANYGKEKIFRLNDQHMKGKFLKQVFSDHAYTEKYIQMLERVSSKVYLDDLLHKLESEIEENLNILYKDYPTYDFSREQLYKNQEDIREILNPHKGIIAHFEAERPSSVMISIASTKAIPTQILSATYKDRIALKPKVAVVTLEGKEYATPLVFNNVEFFFPDGVDGIESPSELRIDYRLLGTSTLRSESVLPTASYDASFLANDFISQQPNFRDFEFVKVDSSLKEIFIEKGHWTLDRPLIIPEGYILVVPAGTTIDLRNSALLLSYSPLRLLGTDDEPITISSQDFSGQGLVVMNTDEESFLENVVFRDLSEPSQGGWQLSGAITLYEAAASLTKCQFLGSRSEDALNIVRSKFTIADCVFEDSRSDALDVDFGEGLIVNTSFINSTNDAMDFSGSVVNVTKSLVDGAGDKGISVGESSQVTATHIVIRNSRIGIASKDLSEMNVDHVRLYKSQIGFAAYQKKSEYGPADLSVRNVEGEDVQNMYLIEKDSTLVLNGAIIEGSQRNVAAGL